MHEDFLKLRRRSLTEDLAQQISEAIFSGQLAPGARIVEVKLAERLGISRGPIREALKLLEGEGLVHAVQGRGTFVTRPSDAQVEDMIVLRCNLEGLAARIVTSTASPADLAELEFINDQMKAFARERNLAKWRDADWMFHEAVCTKANNHFLLQSWRSMRNLIRIYLHVNSEYEQPDLRVVSKHNAFLAAMRSGDPDEAEQMFRSVILLAGYEALRKPVPSHLAAYVTRRVGADGRILKSRPPAARSGSTVGREEKSQEIVP